MKRKIIKNAGVVLWVWIFIAAILSGLGTLWSITTGFIEDPRIMAIYFSILLFPVLWFLLPSIAKEEKAQIRRENMFPDKSKNLNNQNCDAKKLNRPEGGFTCSILGENIGANWLWEESPYKEEIVDSPKCNANFIRERSIFWEKCFFSCWVMGKFRVHKNNKDLELKIRNVIYRLTNKQ